MKAVLLVVLFAVAVQAIWQTPTLRRDATDPLKPVCDLRQSEAAALGFPALYYHCPEGNTTTPCCGDENFAQNGRAERDQFVQQLEADHWVYAEEKFEEYPLDCDWAWDNTNRFKTDPNTGQQVPAPELEDCSTRNQPVFATGSFQTGTEVTKVTAWRKFQSSDTAKLPVLHILDAVVKVGQEYDYSDYESGNGVERDLFGRYIEVLGNEVQPTTDMFMNFSTPIQALSFYMRDISTSRVDGSTVRRIVTINCLNGDAGELPIIFPENGTKIVAEEAAAEENGGVADITYFSARHVGVCDAQQSCKNLKFSNIYSEDHFGMDGLLFANPGSSCDDSSISGYVYADLNSNGARDAGDGVLQTCAGGAVQTTTVTLCKEHLNSGDIDSCVTTTTDNDGFYKFEGLRPSDDVTNPFAYRLRQGNVECYNDGSESVGSFTDGTGILGGGMTAGGNGFGGPILNDEIGQIYIRFGGQTGINFNFGEQSQDPCEVTPDAGCYVPATSGSDTHVCRSQMRLGVSLKWKAADDCACTGNPCSDCKCYGDAGCLSAKTSCL